MIYYIYIYLFVYLFIHLINIVNHNRTKTSPKLGAPDYIVVALSKTASRCLTTTFATTTLTSSGTSASIVGKRSFQGFGVLTKGAGAYLFAISYLIYIYIYISLYIYIWLYYIIHIYIYVILYRCTWELELYIVIGVHCRKWTVDHGGFVFAALSVDDFSMLMHPARTHLQGTCVHCPQSGFKIATKWCPINATTSMI